MHVARPGYAPTEGCVALALPHLEAVLARSGPGDGIRIHATVAGS
jgi:L,D-peptidoglycan transpeptidase YkuD (ErfK/YbiS/YcfS/YnhG family)